MKVIAETERLIIREFGKEEAALIIDLNDEDVLRFTGDKPFNNLSEAEDALHNIILPQYEKYGHGRWALFLKDTGEFIGWCGLKYVAERNEIDLGYRLLKKFRGRGYTTEAAKVSLAYGFDHLNLETIIARAVKENTPSINVMKKTGMTFKEESDDHGKVSVIYQLTQTDYRQLLNDQ